MNSFGNPSVTYGLLSQILAQLGFTRTDTAEYTAFRNSAHDALLALPVVSPQQLVDAAHMAAQAAITGSGAASENTLTCLLLQYSTENSSKPQHSEAA